MVEQALNLPLLVLIPLAGAVLPPIFKRHGLDPAAAAGAVTACAFLAILTNRSPAFAGDTLIGSWDWIPAIGLSIAFRLDGYAFLFGLLITLIGALVIVYARYYLSARDATGRFYGFVLLFQGAMLGVVLSENLIQLAVFWELTSLASFLLVGYWKHDTLARQGARLALFVTGAGGLALLAAFVMLGEIVGSYQLSDVLAASDTVIEHPHYRTVLVLFLLGAFTKSAQFPFHFWLPHAMAAPTPVSAYLHSATMVKAGVFLLGRFFPVFAGTDEWFYLVGGAGVVTLLMGAYHALWQHDLKGLLAYSTISHLGLITLLFGMGTQLSAVAAVFHIMNHAVFKASLFMATGIIDHECGSRDMRKVNGMMKYMPYTAVLAMVAAGAMAGVPLLNGFLSKEMFFAEAVHEARLGAAHWSLPAAAAFAGIGSVAYSLRFIHDVFFNGEPVGLDRVPHEPPRMMRLPVTLLVVVCILVGVVPELVVGPLLRVATAAVLQADAPAFSLAIWHGFNLPFVMSLVAMGGGTLVYVLRHPLFALHDRVFPPLSGKSTAEALLESTYRIAARVNALVENGSLRRYALLLVLATLVLGAAGLRGTPLTGALPLTAPDPVTALGAAILVFAAIATAIVHRHRFLAVLMLGVVGLVVTLVFARFSGPDLAMTQLLVEIVTLIVLLLALYLLPARSPPEADRGRHVRDVVLAVLAGAGAGALTWAMTTRSHRTISDFFVDVSVPGGGGHNVVNVILVDFRAFDTLGEITVLVIAAIGVVAMLRGLGFTRPARDPEGRAWARDAYPAMLSVVSRPVLPLALLLSAYLLLRGHNEPGGGFIAALVTASALVLQFVARGSRWATARLPVAFAPVAACGLVVATLAGMGSWLFDYPFLTSSFGHVFLPLVGEAELATAMLFDIGVYLAVVGAVLLTLTDLGEVGQRPPADGERG